MPRKPAVPKAKTAAAPPMPEPVAASVRNEPYLVGEWAGKPNYGCPFCPFKTISGPGEVELHILSELDRASVRHLPALDLKQ